MENSDNKGTILIVDDDALLAEHNKILLQKSGYKSVDIALDPEQAIRLTKDKSPDLILMDINLNDQYDGIKTAEEIQKIFDVPIIFVTAFSDPDTINRAKKVAPFGFIMKPFESREFLVAVETALYKHSFDKKIKRQELLFRTVANFAYEWEFWLTPDLKFRYCSPSCKRISEYTAEEFLDDPKLLFEIVHPDDKREFEKHTNHFYSENVDEVVKDFQFRIINKRGEVKFISHTCSPILDDNGNYIGRRVTNIDVTKNKRMENLWKMSENNYRNIFQFAHDAILILEPETEKVLAANERACELYGFTKEEFIGSSLLDISKNRETGQKIFRELNKKGFVNNLETTQFRKDGSEIFLELNTSFIEYNGKTAILSMNHDITERKYAEKKLIDNENMLRTLFEHSGDFALVLKDDGNDDLVIIDATNSASKLHGYKHEEFIGKKISEIDRDFGKIFIHDKINKLKLGELLQFESVHYRKDGSSFPVEIIAKTARLPEGQIVVFSIERDITDKKHTEDLLVAANERLKSIFNAVSDIIFVMDFDEAGELRFTSVNQAFSSITGLDSKSVLGKPIKEVISETSLKIFFKNYKKAFESKSMVKWEETSDYPNGQLIGEVSILPLFNEEGACVNLIGSIHDITERKKAELELKKSEKRYKDLFNDDLTGDYIVKVDGTIIICNPALARMFGVASVEEFNKLNVKDFYRYNHSREDFLNKVRKEKKLTNYEHDLIRIDGEVISIIENVIGEFDEHGELVRLKGYMFDNTERKKAQTALRQSEERFRTVYNLSPAAISISEIKTGKIIEVNEAYEKLFGYTYEESIGKTSLELGIWVDNEDRNILLKPFLQSGNYNGIEIKFKNKNGNILDCLVSGRMINIKNQQLMLSLVNDITELKLAEKALSESEKKFRLIAENTSDGILVIDKDKGAVYASPSYFKIMGHTSFDISSLDSEKISDIIHPDDRERIFNLIYSAMDAAVPHLKYSYKARREDGIYIWREDTTTLNYDENGEFVDAYVICRDITKSKLAEEKLRESELKFRSLVETASEGIWMFDANYNTTFVNKAMADMLGYKISEIKGRSIKEFLSDDEHKYFESRQDARLKGEIGSHERKFLRKDGKLIYTFVSSNSLFDAENKYIGAFGMITNITEKKKTEAILKNNAEQFKLLTSTSIDGFWKIDKNAKLVEVNDVYCKIVGYTREELLNMKVNDLESKENVVDTAKHIKHIMDVGYDRFESQHRCKDGSVVDFLVSATYSKKLELLLVFFSDITKRKKAEKDLLNQMKEIQRFNKLMVGREFKMIGLKQEVNFLLEQMGKEKKYNVKDSLE